MLSYPAARRARADCTRELRDETSAQTCIPFHEAHAAITQVHDQAHVRARLLGGHLCCGDRRQRLSVVTVGIVRLSV